MICISVTPTSRTLAPADLLNASRHGDLIELCLDHFLKEPDVADLIRMVDKPVLVSCRRPIDGGHWTGSEDQRLHLLRQAIVAGPEYIELDLEIADQIPRFGATRRVISCTSLNRPLEHVAAAIDRCIRRSMCPVVELSSDADSANRPRLLSQPESTTRPLIFIPASIAGRRDRSPGSRGRHRTSFCMRSNAALKTRAVAFSDAPNPMMPRKRVRGVISCQR